MRALPRARRSGKQKRNRNVTLSKCPQHQGSLRPKFRWNRDPESTLTPLQKLTTAARYPHGKQLIQFIIGGANEKLCLTSSVAETPY